ncbi:MAG: preprotein translocase subunit YajC [Pseudomonadales bacterium]|nr:preprotein translocase subunit YajC [Pseudomonadales bacterium]
MNFFINSAYAQGTAATPANPAYQFFILGGFVLIFYLIIWRPQAKRAKEHKALIASIAKGDEVLTNAGMLGKVTKVDEHYVSVQVADNVELKMQKSSIAAALPKGTIKSI